MVTQSQNPTGVEPNNKRARMHHIPQRAVRLELLNSEDLFHR